MPLGDYIFKAYPKAGGKAVYEPLLIGITSKNPCWVVYGDIQESSDALPRYSEENIYDSDFKGEIKAEINHGCKCPPNER